MQLSRAAASRSYFWPGAARLQRKTGRLNGWVGYTLSWTQHQFADLNDGKPFYARYDRRHDLSVVGIYQLKPRLSLSATFVFGTRSFTIHHLEECIAGLHLTPQRSSIAIQLI